MDLMDSAILNYLITICNSKNEKIEKERIDGYTWVSYRKIIKDMPLLRIKSKGAITPRIRRIEENGYISVKTINQRMYISLTAKVDELFMEMNSQGETVHETKRKTIHETEHDNNINIYYKNNVNVVKKYKKPLTDVKRGQLEYHLERIGDQRNIKAWVEVVHQIGFQTAINILIDVSESTDAKNKGACAMGLAKKAGFKKFFRPNKDRL